MTTGTIELLLHPVRLRIVNAMSGGQALTTSELCAHMPDVSKASVYRHVGLLAEGGILDVADERRVRGAVERRYILRRERTLIDVEASSAMSLDDHRRGFTAAMAALLAEFSAYLDREDANPLADSVSYRQAVIWLSQDELAELVNEVRHAIMSRASNAPVPGRAPHMLSTILFPIAQPAAPPPAIDDPVRDE